MMKVAIVSTEALITPPQKYGGIEQVVYDLCKGLVELGVDVTLFACEGSKSPSGKLVEVIPEGWGKAGQLEEFGRRMFNLKSILEEFDVVHDNSHWKPCWGLHRRVLNTMHWKQHPSQCNYKNVTAISELIAKWLKPHNLGKDVPVVHNGIDITKYEFKAEKGERYLFLSRISAYKGADIALLLAKKLDLPMDFAGLGGEIQIRNEGNIRCYGEVSLKEKITLYQNARALIFPTGAHGDWEEPFGLVAIEAMSCGTPVITWNSGAMPEIVKNSETGFICNSMEEMEEAVKRIDEIKPLNCRRVVEENFTYQAMAKKYITLYNRLLGGNFW